MKLVTAIIKENKLAAVLAAVEGVDTAGIAVSEVRGLGGDGGYSEFYRGAEYQSASAVLPRVRVEIAAPDEAAADVAEMVAAAAKTGKAGDGAVFVVAAEMFVGIGPADGDGDGGGGDGGPAGGGGGAGAR